MGICSSVDTTLAATAKLILPDSTLLEYSHPIKANYVLQRFKNDAFFICNADEMDFNDVVFGLSHNEKLMIGELYFLLPLTALRRPLKAAEMAELAVRASAALMNSGGGGAWLSGENAGSVESGGCDGKGRRMRVAEDGGRRRRRTHSTDLSTIAE